MNIVEIISKKRDKQELTAEEIDWFIQSYTAGEVADYQASALLMAIYLNGMSRQETVDLTLAIVASGETLDLHDTLDFIVDKHSSGGVGDKTTLVVLPMVAACGVPVAKMSGRGLGYSGGTLDKMESIAGWTANLPIDQIKKQAAEIGLVLAGQTASLAPADGKLYALRDVTGTVGSMPLIASSIMSKKLAAGSDAIVLDVKVGSGAFIKTIEDGRKLAEIMVNIGKDAGRQTVAILSDMNQPLGHAAGNGLEVQEAIYTLTNAPQAPADFWEHCLKIGSYMVLMAGKADDLDTAEKMLTASRDSGEAFNKFKQMISAQSGDLSMVDDPNKLPKAQVIKDVTADTSGTIQSMDTEQLGYTVVHLGGGRLQKSDAINPAVGFVMPVRIGDKISSGQLIATVHAADAVGYERAKKSILESVKIGEGAVDPLPHFYGVIE